MKRRRRHETRRVVDAILEDGSSVSTGKRSGNWVTDELEEDEGGKKVLYFRNHGHWSFATWTPRSYPCF